MSAEKGIGSENRQSLEGLTIAVTRPAHQAENLCLLIEKEGAKTLRYPVIEILPAANPTTLKAHLQTLSEYQLAIFISSNAVHFAYQVLGDEALPTGLQRVAVGRATARALSQHAQPAHIQAPKPYNSEALLALPELHAVREKRVIIFRGNNGRALLADTLKARGAQVEYAEVYQRSAGNADPKQLYQAWDTGNLDLMIVTSNEGLQNLYESVDVDHRESLLGTTLVVISKRSADLAQKLGFLRPVIVAQAASDNALLEAAKSYRQE